MIVASYAMPMDRLEADSFASLSGAELLVLNGERTGERHIANGLSDAPLAARLLYDDASRLSRSCSPT